MSQAVRAWALTLALHLVYPAVLGWAVGAYIGWDVSRRIEARP